MEMFFVMWVCSYQNFQGAACASSSGAYFQYINSQAVLDKANKKYIAPLPADLKNVAIVGYAVYTKRVHINLYRGVGVDIRVDKYNENNHTVESTANLVSISRSFK